jgi:hypothetical protein
VHMYHNGFYRIFARNFMIDLHNPDRILVFGVVTLCPWQSRFCCPSFSAQIVRSV